MKKLLFVLSLFLITALSSSQNVVTIKSIDEYKALLDSSKGKVTLVNFWATWCPPCVKEFPELVKLYKDYKDKEFNLFFISLDDKTEYESKLIPFLKKQGVDFTAYFGDFSKPEELMGYVDKSWQGEIPYTGIYNKEGKLVKTFLGSQKYEQFEKEILKALD